MCIKTSVCFSEINHNENENDNEKLINKEHINRTGSRARHKDTT